MSSVGRVLLAQGAPDQHAASEVRTRSGIGEDIVSVGFTVRDTLDRENAHAVDPFARDQIADLAAIRSRMPRAELERGAVRERQAHHRVVAHASAIDLQYRDHDDAARALAVDQVANFQ